MAAQGHAPSCGSLYSGTGRVPFTLASSGVERAGHKGVKDARFDLLPWDALWLVARLYGKGAEKYAARNWERGYEYTKSLGALHRHVAKFASGEDIDPEMGLPHLTCAIFHALALLTFSIRGVGIDDRPKMAGGVMVEHVTNPEEIEEAKREAGGV